MSLVYQTPIVSWPFNAVAVHEGYIYKLNGSYHLDPVTAKNNTPFGVAMKSSMDVQTGTAKTLADGDEAEVALVRSKTIVNVAFEAGCNVYPFVAVYLSDGSDGMASVTSTNATLIGHAIVKEVTASTASGQLLPVMLDS